VSSDFSTALDQKKVPDRKHVFITATPRLNTGYVVKEARENDLEVASMNDLTIFAPVLHRISFAEAIDQDLLSDYRLVTVGIDDERYRGYAERGQLVELEGVARPMPARWLPISDL